MFLLTNNTFVTNLRDLTFFRAAPVGLSAR